MTDYIERVGHASREYALEAMSWGYGATIDCSMKRRLEDAFATKLGRKYGVTFVNGTAAIHMAIEAMGPEPGDEVIVPALGYANVAMAVLMANCIPVFADVDPDTCTISPQSIRERIASRTRAIVTSALFGLMPDMDAVMNVANGHGVPVIEDCGHCLLGFYKGKLAGTIGHGGCFTFESMGHITCGDGGILVTDDRDFANRARKYGGLGFIATTLEKLRPNKRDIQDPACDRVDTMGWNYRTTDPDAGVVLGQLERVEELAGRRREVHRIFSEAVKGCDWIVPQRVSRDHIHAGWAFAAKIGRSDIGWRAFRDRYTEFGGKGLNAVWKPAYMEPAFRDYRLLSRTALVRESGIRYEPGICPAAEDLQRRLILLRTDSWDLERAVACAEALKSTVRYFSDGCGRMV